MCTRRHEEKVEDRRGVIHRASAPDGPSAYPDEAAFFRRAQDEFQCYADAMLRPLSSLPSLLFVAASLALVACAATPSSDDAAAQSADVSASPVMQACRGERSCFSALDGRERGLCEAYKEGRSCFSSLDGEDRGWCQVIVEGRSCFMSLDGEARERCEDGRYPAKHLYWKRCGGH